MRHLIGFTLALAMSAALFFGGGLGGWRITTAGTGSAHATWGALTSVHGLLPLGALLATGLLLGILLAAKRVSPLATGLPGLVLLGWSALVVLHGRSALRFVPLHGSHFATGFTALLSTGALALTGAVMIVPLLWPSRWRRRDTYHDDDDFDDDDFSVPSALGLVP